MKNPQIDKNKIAEININENNKKEPINNNSEMEQNIDNNRELYIKKINDLKPDNKKIYLSYIN